MFGNGGDTAEVKGWVTRFAGAFGCEAHFMVSYEALLLTIVAGGQFRTKVGYRVPAMNVNMAAIADVSTLGGEVENGRRGMAEGRAELGDVERRPPLYGRGVLVVARGLTPPALGRFLGGGWATL